MILKLDGGLIFPVVAVSPCGEIQAHALINALLFSEYELFYIVFETRKTPISVKAFNILCLIGYGCLLRSLLCT